MSTNAERSADSPATNRAGLVYLWRGTALGVAVAIAIALIDWGGVDRSTGTRVSAGVFALLSVVSLTTAVLSGRWRMHRSSIEADVSGALAMALMVPGELVSNPWVAGAFMVAATVCLLVSLVAANRYRRESRAHGSPDRRATTDLR